MREIKFRAYQKNHKKMVDVVSVDFKLNHITADYGELAAPRLNTFDIKHFALMQYTGLKDKNGQEVYEGDVVEVHDFNRHKGVIKFGEYEQDGSAGEYGPDNCLGFYVDAIGKKQTDEFGLNVIPYFRETHTVLGFDSIEVIGNIYENPELLEGESK